MLRTSGFVDDVVFSYYGASGPESSTTLRPEEVRRVAVPVGRQDDQRLIELIRMRHWGRSLLSTIDLCWVCIFHGGLSRLAGNNKLGRVTFSSDFFELTRCCFFSSYMDKG